MKRLAVALAFTLAAALAGCSGSSSGPYAAPKLAGPTIDGGHVDLATLRGSPVVVLFGAKWCDPCTHDWPLVNAATKRVAGLKVVGVAYQESASLMEEFVRSIGATFPVADDSSGDIADAWQVHGIPQTFFVDRAGRVVTRIAGIPDGHELDADIAKITK